MNEAMNELLTRLIREGRQVRFSVRSDIGNRYRVSYAFAGDSGRSFTAFDGLFRDDATALADDLNWALGSLLASPR